MKLIEDKITLSELTEMSGKMFGNLVKAVVDVEQGVMLVDAEMHIDQELDLLQRGSKQENLWGINIHPSRYGTEKFIEFDSMINIRPRQGNRSRSVEDINTQKKILDITSKLIVE